MWFLELYSVSS